MDHLELQKMFPEQRQHKLARIDQRRGRAGLSVGLTRDPSVTRRLKLVVRGDAEMIRHSAAASGMLPT